MANGFYNDYDERLLGEGTDTKYEEDPRTEKEPESEEYYELPPAIRSRSLIWAVISFSLGILSLLISKVYYVSIAFALVSIGSSLISRRNLGFFEKYSIMGLIFGIMGAVCSIFSFIASAIGLFA